MYWVCESYKWLIISEIDFLVFIINFIELFDSLTL